VPQTERDVALDACVKNLDAVLSGNHDHHQKSGYAKAWTYFHGSIQVFCGRQNTLGNYFCKGIYVEILQSNLDSATHSARNT
jgi:hypothetical protein